MMTSIPRGDVLSIFNLLLPPLPSPSISQSCGVFTDAWSRPGKFQPIYISLHLQFSRPFASSTTTDSLSHGDTIHYGALAKTILASASRSHPNDDGSVDFLLRKLYDEILDLAGDDGMLQSCVLKLNLDKATLSGDNVVLGHRYSNEREMGKEVKVQKWMEITGLKIPTVVGVNDHERKERQMLRVSLEIYADEKYVSKQAMGEYVALERACKDIMFDSTFETLEALAACIARGIYKDWMKKYTPQANLRIRIDKAMGVVFAEYATVEINRNGNDLARQLETSQVNTNIHSRDLKITRPYVTTELSGS